MTNKDKSVYIIGIAGRTTSSVAAMFKSLGYKVTGSDQSCYPPASTMLDDLGVNYHAPYDASLINEKPDLVVIGGNALIVDKDNPEYHKLKGMGCRIVSFPEVLNEFVVKDNSIVCVGTYAKTTNSALLSVILDCAEINPSFMIGGVPKNYEWGIRATESAWSVVEGDEHPTIGFDMRPKFVHYRPKFVYLTATAWDHMNVYPTLESYITAFQDLAKSIPEDGLLVAHDKGENNLQVTKYAKCPVVFYGDEPDSKYKIENIEYLPDSTNFTVNAKQYHTDMIGRHNVENAVGCLALLSELNLAEKFQEGMDNFLGVVKRLEVKGVKNGITFIDDFAHSAIKAKASINAVRSRFKDQQLVVVFDPHASSLKESSSLPLYEHAFSEASEVIIAQIPRTKGTGEERVTGPMIVEAIKPTQPNVSYIPSDQEIVDYLVSNLETGSAVIFMSSGSFRDLLPKTMGALSDQ